MGIIQSQNANLRAQLADDEGIVNIPYSLDDEQLAYLVEQLKTDASIKSLQLSHTNPFVWQKSRQLGESGIKILAGAIAVNKTLTSLRIPSQNISKGLDDLSIALRENSTLTELNILRNNIDASCLNEFAVTLSQTKSLKSIELRGNPLKADGCAILSKALAENNSVTCLALRETNIDEVGAVEIGKMLKVNKCLTHLVLRANEIGPHGAVAIGVGLSFNRTLKNFDLAMNRISDIGAIGISKGLSTSCLVNLDLYTNQISDVGIKLVVESLQKSKYIEKLNLSCNKIGLKGATAIAKFIDTNLFIRTVKLVGCFSDTESRELIADSLEKNEFLEAQALNLPPEEYWQTGIARQKWQSALHEWRKTSACLLSVNQQDRLQVDLMHALYQLTVPPAKDFIETVL